ncbi:MAG TPA: hypothetical protein VKT81_07415 [Bryobacteraceae bacterium]|nr:hypothetical protein [Bryobacteraceae bacterium]
MRRWKDRFWPIIDSPESARGAVDRAARVTTIWALVCIALGLVMLLSGAKTTDPAGSAALSGVAFLVPGILYGVIAWKIRRMSRGWTLGGFILSAFVLLDDLAFSPSIFSLIACVVVLVYFVNALRAVIAYERLVADQPISDVLGIQ